MNWPTCLRTVALLFTIVPTARAGEDPPTYPLPMGWTYLHVACYARPSDTGHYGGYYVGGSAVCKGEPRGPQEGTWGWDYTGCGCLGPCVYLQWLHGRRYRNSAGGYRIDGPHLLHPHEPDYCAPGPKAK
jgi:hypothetical protein